MSIKCFLNCFLVLLLLPVSVHAVGQAEWEGQINDAFNQAHRSTQGLKGQQRAQVERYLNQAENLWNQSKGMHYMQNQYQQQNQMNKIYMQQQNSNLFMQQQFLKNQSALKKSSTLQTINPFGDYLFHGVSIRPEDGRLHGPGTIADTPALSGLFNSSQQMQNSVGMRVLDETRQLEKSQNISSNSSVSAAAQASSINATGLWDNPIANNTKGTSLSANLDSFSNDPNVVDLSDKQSLNPSLLRADGSKQFGIPITSDGLNSNPYSEMSEERLKKKEAALTEALRQTQKLTTENAKGFADVENDAASGKEDATKTALDAATTFALGSSSYVAGNNSERLLNNAIDLSPGQTKIDAMKLSANAITLEKDVDYVSKTKDVADFTDLANQGELGEAVGQGAMMLGDALVKSPTRFNPTPLSAIPGTVKLGIDTSLVWTNYYFVNQEYKRQEQLSQQLEANRLKLTNQLNEIREELNKRKSSGLQH